MIRNHVCLPRTLMVALGALLLVPSAAYAQGQPETLKAPATQASASPLIITSDQIPEDLKDKIYNRPARVREITAMEVTGTKYYEPMQTQVTHKIDDLGRSLGALQNSVTGLSDSLNALQKDNEHKAAEYYADIATISTQLQSGTTPGNPRLLRRVGEAESSLENLAASVSNMNQLGMDIAAAASEASYLLESTRAAYSLSGAVEEDHVYLSELEDAVNNTIVVIERLLNNVNDDITRTSTYLSSERNNLRALELAVTTGDLYGKSLSNRPFSNASLFQASAPSDMSVRAEPAIAGGGMGGTAPVQALSGPRLLVKIRFDKPDVNYEQPVYMAVNEALERYPNARFDLVAVNPTKGNAAEVAIESTKARRNAERVLRTLTQMGLALDRVDLSYNQSDEAESNEVHLYIR